MEKENKNTGIIVLVVIMSLLVVSLSGYIAYDKFLSNNDAQEKDNCNNNSNTSTTLTESEAKNISQSIYETAYSIIAEGSGLSEKYNSGTAVKKQYNSETLTCWEIKVYSLKNLFTENGINYLKSNFGNNFTDDDKYYTCENTDTFMSKSENWIRTIFSGTDSGLRDLKIISFDNNSIKATGQLEPCTAPVEGVCSGAGDKKPLNITFKKVNDVWQIDTFE